MIYYKQISKFIPANIILNIRHVNYLTNFDQNRLIRRIISTLHIKSFSFDIFTLSSSVKKDVPDTAMILRKHGVGSNLFSCLMFNELDAFNHRDQLAFAFVRDKMKPKIKINMFEVEVFEQIVLEYRHTLKRRVSNSIATSASQHKIVRARRDISEETMGLGKCFDYFVEMWGESH